MKNYIFVLATAMLSCSFAYSEDSPSAIKNESHQLYIGPDVFLQHAKLYHGSKDARANSLYGGLKLGYDSMKPQSFYWGADGIVAFGSTKVHWSEYGYSYNGWGKINLSSSASSLFANIESRYGYAFQSSIAENSTITSFTGLGWYYIDHKSDKKSSSWVYGTLGLKANQRFCKDFDVGFSIKAMYGFAGQVISSYKNGMWGYEAALPLTWYTLKKWDLQFQPYLLKLNIDNTSHILGARLQAVYSF